MGEMETLSVGKQQLQLDIGETTSGRVDSSLVGLDTPIFDLGFTSMDDINRGGRYALAGYSYGTMLAFEMAKQLGDVQFLGSFNLPPHIKTVFSTSHSSSVGRCQMSLTVLRVTSFRLNTCDYLP